MPDALLLLLGVALLVVGAHAFVDGASRLAASLGVSELTIGLTVVAFGTSAPELAVNLLAAVGGNTAIAFGNVVGSNLANSALVIGLCALVRPLLMESAIVSREIPMMLLATVAGLVLGLDRIRGAPEVYDRSDGITFLILFAIYIYYSIGEVIAKRSRDRDPLLLGAAEQVHARTPGPAAWPVLVSTFGLVVLLVGARLTVTRAVALAEALQVPRDVVALSIVAVGTSLPELATSLVATWKGQTSLAIGNVVGSNLFNLLFVLGTTAVIRPVELPAVGGAWDLVAMALFALGLLPLSRSLGSRIGRAQGGLLVVAYLGYLAWRLWG